VGQAYSRSVTAFARTGSATTLSCSDTLAGTCRARPGCAELRGDGNCVRPPRLPTAVTIDRLVYLLIYRTERTGRNGHDLGWLGKPNLRGQTVICPFRTQEVAGSSPASASVLDPTCVLLSELTRILYPFCTQLSRSHRTARCAASPSRCMQETQILTCRSVSVLALPAT
jgi:hypothetical protein